MDCPGCRNEMMGLELEGVEIDTCPDCHGIWLDEGELEILSGSPEGAEALLGESRTARRTGERHRRCPRCYRKMGKTRLGGEEGPVVDRCAHGLWFDAGELQQVLETGSIGGAADPLLRFLGDLFRARGAAPCGS